MISNEDFKRALTMHREAIAKKISDRVLIADLADSLGVSKVAIQNARGALGIESRRDPLRRAKRYVTKEEALRIAEHLTESN